MGPQDGIKPIEVGHVLSETFALIRDRAPTLFGLAFLATLPTRLWIYVLPGLIVSLKLTSYPAALVFGAVSAGLIAGVMGLLGQGALIGTALAKSEGRTADFFISSLPVIRRTPVLAAIALVDILGTFLGFVWFVIPGVMLSLMWSVVGPVAVAEQTSIVETFRRSQALTNNNLSRIFLLKLAGGLGSSAFVWVARKVAGQIFGVGADGLNYPFAPVPFLIGSLIDLLKTGFDLALVCALYVALIQRDGSGPMHQRLNRIFE